MNFKAFDQIATILLPIGIDCGPPPQADTSGYIANKSCLHMFGSVASYQCFPGHVLIANSQVQCGLNGDWAGIAPTCQGRFPGRFNDGKIISSV